MKDSTFYMVLADGSAYTKHRHPTFDAAKEEARRLAAKHPGTRFYVLRACGFQRVIAPDTWTGLRADANEPTQPIPW